MSDNISIRPPNSLLFIADSSGTVVVPDIVRGQSIWSTSSCVAFGCLMEQDGPTEVTIGSANEVASDKATAFDGHLETPNRTVIVSTSENVAVLTADVPETTTRVRIWTNHPSEPDKVVLGLG